MNYLLTIHCTKEHLDKALLCGTPTDSGPVAQNCWIALAVQDIFPMATVGTTSISNTLRCYALKDHEGWSIELPEEAKAAIVDFDRPLIGWNSKHDSLEELERRLQDRRALQPFSFTVSIPQETLGIIMCCNGLKSMQEVKNIVSKTPHLELCEA